jgi:hypothetical protein
LCGEKWRVVCGKKEGKKREEVRSRVEKKGGERKTLLFLSLFLSFPFYHFSHLRCGVDDRSVR